MGIQVRIIELNKERCEKLSVLLPNAVIIHGDATNKSLLLEEGLEKVESVVSITNMDEENLLLSMFAKNHSHAKVVTKVNRISFDDVIDSLDIGSVIYPKYLTADYIDKYVRPPKTLLAVMWRLYTKSWITVQKPWTFHPF